MHGSKVIKMHDIVVYCAHQWVEITKMAGITKIGKIRLYNAKVVQGIG